MCQTLPGSGAADVLAEVIEDHVHGVAGGCAGAGGAGAGIIRPFSRANGRFPRLSR